MTGKEKKIKTVVLGIGNILLGDEGVGVHLVDRLKKMDFPSSVLFIDGATAGFKLISIFKEYKDADFIIIDSLAISEKYYEKSNEKEKDSGVLEPRAAYRKGEIFVVPLSDFYNIDNSKYFTDGFISFHQTALIDVLGLLDISQKIKIEGCFVGINISDTKHKGRRNELDLSMGLSKEIESKIPEILNTIIKIIAEKIK